MRDILLSIISHNVILYRYTVFLSEGFMVGEHITRTQQKWACIQFIAEVSLIANCKPADLKLALTIIADLAHSENDNEESKEIFYKAE